MEASAEGSKISDVVELTRDPIDVLAATQRTVRGETGAVSTFIGTTRNHLQGKKVLRLEYEAYEPMALAEMRSICSKLRLRFGSFDQTERGLADIVLIHRIGEVPVSEASVFVAVSSVHRSESLQACALAIDLIKELVPIWKKELYLDGSSSWKENCECSLSHSHRHPPPPSPSSAPCQSHHFDHE